MLAGHGSSWSLHGSVDGGLPAADGLRLRALIILRSGREAVVHQREELKVWNLANLQVDC
jgi:hypothetical protein